MSNLHDYDEDKLAEDSLSAAKAKVEAQGIDLLLPVQVDRGSETYLDYYSTFYPQSKVSVKEETAEGDEVGAPKKKRVTHNTDKTHYFELAQYLAKVSAYVNVTFAHLRWLVKEAEYTNSPDEMKDFDRSMRTLLGRINQADIMSAAKNFMFICGSGKQHIIRPSTKFPGGYDIIYSGIPGAGAGKSSCITLEVGTNQNEVPQYQTSWDYRREVAIYEKPWAATAIKKANEIQNALLGKNVGQVRQNIHSHLRQSHMVPLDFDFRTTVASILHDKETAAVYGPDKIANIDSWPQVPKHLVTSLGKFFSILINLEPNNAEVNFMYSHAEAETSIPENHLTSNTYLATQPDISFSIVAHIPKEVAEYITQTQPGNKLSLVALNTWASVWSRALLRAPKSKTQGGRIKIKNVPRYILPASSTTLLNEARKKLGFYTEEGRTNEDDMFVSNTGRLNYCPKAAELAMDNAVNYEKILEEALEVSFAAGSPLKTDQIGETSRCFSLAFPDYREKIGKLKQNLTKYAGCVQSYSWDYNCILTSGLTDPDKLNAISLQGAVKPNDLSLADYLRKPFAQSMAILFNSTSDENRKPISSDHFGGRGEAAGMLKTSLFKNFYSLYSYLLQKKLVPEIQDLVTSAAKELGYSSLRLEHPEQATEAVAYEKDLYHNVIDTNFNVSHSYKNGDTPEAIADKTTNAINELLRVVLQDSYGSPRTNLARVASRKGEDAVNDPHYFSPAHFTLAEFKNIYNYLGGRVFLLALRAILKVPKKALFVIDTEFEGSRLPNYNSLVREVMPMATVFSKYVIDSEAIYEKADAIIESNKKDPSITPDEIRIPGTVVAQGDKNGFQMFPHQVEGNQYLRGPVPPKVAILDVAPGGGKTALLLSDIACLINDGHIRRPCVIAPNGLVRNWVDDMIKVTGGTWNMIPVITLTYNTWEDERLTKMIQTAPRNTIVVIGYTATKILPYNVVIGNHVEPVSVTLEFLKKFGFDYIAIDESHKLKRATTAIHKAVKQLCVMSSVKYIRLATGTLVSNKITDVVGQAALFNPQIFRTAAEFEAEHGTKVGNTTVPVFNEGVPQLARRQLNKFASVISFKRKEWAFMLPRPLEEFIPVRLEKAEEEGGKAHQAMYEAILKITLDEIKKDAKVKRILAGRGDDDDDEDDDDEDEGTKSKSVKDGEEEDLDEETVKELEKQLSPYLARLEQMLTDPLGDPFGKIYFSAVDQENFVSNKVLKIIERIKLNFIDYPWEKGRIYNLKDLADYDGKRYVLMGKPGELLTLASYEEQYTSTLPPDKDPRWKEESRGKVLVFCRYTRTVNAIYKHLPPDLKAMAVKFHGDEKGKQMNLNRFLANPISKDKGVQIMVANEQALTDGYNLQMASRLIRVEAPWCPGDLDQAQSRIFRPDPTHKFKRENIYLDWVLSNNTLEVNKMGRLISKMVSKSQFDESDNPLYDPLQDYAHLPPINMGLELLRTMPVLSDISEYIDAYRLLAHIQASEFEEMRQTKPSAMVDIEATAMFPDAAIIEHVPYLPGMDIVDRHNFGLVKFVDYLDDEDDPEVAEILDDKKQLIGRYVHTQFGNGVIIGLGLTGKQGRDPDRERKVTKVHIQLASGDIHKSDPSLIFLATNLNEETVKQFTPTIPWATPADKRRAARLERMAAKQKEKDDHRKAREEQERKEIEAKRKAQQAADKKKRPKPLEEDVVPSIELYQVIYNGFLALEAVPEDEEGDNLLKSYKYSQFGDYAYIKVPTAVAFDSILDYIEARYELSKDSQTRLNYAADSFKTRGKKAFDVELAPIQEFKNFYMLRHKVSTVGKTKKPVIKMYPVVNHGVLMLNVDISTNPAIKKVIGKAIPGCPNKFDDASSLFIKFFPTKSELIKHVNLLKKSGVDITNYQDLVDDVRATSFKKGMK